MKKTTFRLPTDLLADLDDLAEQRDESTAAVVRELLQDAVDDDHGRDGVDARIRDLEDRLADVERAVGTDGAPDGGTDGAPATRTDGAVGTDGAPDGDPTPSAVPTDGAPDGGIDSAVGTDGATDGRLRDLVDDADWSDVMVSRTDDRVDAVARVLEDVRDHGPIQGAHLRDDLDADDLAMSDSSLKRMLSDVLGDLDVVERDGYAYRWTGEE